MQNLSVFVQKIIAAVKSDAPVHEIEALLLDACEVGDRLFNLKSLTLITNMRKYQKAFSKGNLRSDSMRSKLYEKECDTLLASAWKQENELC